MPIKLFCTSLPYTIYLTKVLVCSFITLWKYTKSTRYFKQLAYLHQEDKIPLSGLKIMIKKSLYYCYLFFLCSPHVSPMKIFNKVVVTQQNKVNLGCFLGSETFFLGNARIIKPTYFIYKKENSISPSISLGESCR